MYKIIGLCNVVTVFVLHPATHCQEPLERELIESIKRNIQRVADDLRKYIAHKGKQVETPPVVTLMQMLARLGTHLSRPNFSTNLLRELTMMAVSLTYPKFQYSNVAR